MYHKQVFGNAFDWYSTIIVQIKQTNVNNSLLKNNGRLGSRAFGSTVDITLFQEGEMKSEPLDNEEQTRSHSTGGNLLIW